jgi:hypothetical protein
MWFFEVHEVIFGEAIAITCLWRRNIQLCHWTHHTVWCITIRPYHHSNSHVLKQQLSCLVQLCNVARWQKLTPGRPEQFDLYFPNSEWDKIIISIFVKKVLLGNWHVKPLNAGSAYAMLKVVQLICASAMSDVSFSSSHFNWNTIQKNSSSHGNTAKTPKDIHHCFADLLPNKTPRFNLRYYILDGRQKAYQILPLQCLLLGRETSTDAPSSVCMRVVWI